MGNAIIYYMPLSESGTTYSIDFGSRIMNRKGPTTVVRQAVTEKLDGSLVTVHYSGKAQIVVQHRWDNTADGRELRRKLQSLVNHLQRGGFCTLVEDVDYGFAGFASRIPGARTRDIPYIANLVSGLIGSDPSITDRELEIVSDPESYLREMRKVSSHTPATHTITLPTPGTKLDYTGSDYMLIREWGTWPALRLSKDGRNGDFVQHDHEINFVLELPLEEDTETLAALASTNLQFPAETGGVQHDWPGLGNAGVFGGSLDAGTLGGTGGGWLR